MSDAAVLREDPLRPHSEDGLSSGAIMAVLAHLLLVVALAFGVRWHASEPEGVTAELWASVPQVAAPQAAEPPPQPVEAPKPPPKAKEPEPEPQAAKRDAEIAIEKEREKQKKLQQEQAQREKLAKEKADKEKAEKEKADKAKADAEAKRKEQQDQARLAKLREDYLKRVMGQASGPGPVTSTGTAARTAGPSASYGGRVAAAIHPNIVYTDEINAIAGNPRAEVEIRLAPDGRVLGRRVVQSSGVKEWDEAVLRAIDRTAVLPRDTDGSVPPLMNIGFRPKDLPKA
jgi:colicin import membrane protein